MPTQQPACQPRYLCNVTLGVQSTQGNYAKAAFCMRALQNLPEHPLWMVFEATPTTPHYVDFGKVVAAELSLPVIAWASRVLAASIVPFFFILASPFKHAILPLFVEWRVNGMMEFFTPVSVASFVPNQVQQSPTASSASPITILIVVKGWQMSGLRRWHTTQEPAKNTPREKLIGALLLPRLWPIVRS